MKKTFKDVWKNYLLKLGLIILFISIDLLSKHFFYGTENIIILPGVLGFRDANGLNTGGAWGVMGEHTWLLIAITIIFLVGIIAFECYRKDTHPLYTVAISLVLGGTLGNLIDRIFLGGVRDFIYFIFMPSFPTFNFADSCLIIGMILLIIYIFFVYKDDEDKKSKELLIPVPNIENTNKDNTSNEEVDKKDENKIDEKDNIKKE